MSKTETPITIATPGEAIDLMKKVKGQFVTITYRSETRMAAALKRELGGVFSVSNSQVKMGVRYQNVVNAVRGREGLEKDFQAQSTWGTPIEEGSCLVVHKGSVSVGCEFKKSLGGWYENAKGERFSEADCERIRSALYAKSKSKTQGTEKETEWRKYRVDRILGIKAMGKHYLLAENLEFTQHIAAVQGKTD